MRVHSLVAPRYNHYAGMTGQGFKNLKVYKGKGGALLTPGRKKALKAVALAAAMAAGAAVGGRALGHGKTSTPFAGEGKFDDDDFDENDVDYYDAATNSFVLRP